LLLRCFKMNISLLYSCFVFGVGVPTVFIVAIFIFRNYYFSNYYIKTLPTKFTFSSYCNNQSQILLLQRQQILKARLAIFGNFHHGYLSKSANLQFYKHSFGEYHVPLPRNSKGFTEIVYHRIFKSGNNNIRTLLYNFAYLKFHKKFSSLLDCLPECTFSNKFSQSWFIQQFLVYIIYPKTYFSFTFVREPISRFISAMNEIEYRIKTNPWKQPYFSLTAKLGSVERFQEFVEYILLHGDSKTFFLEHGNVELSHIAPMIGTFISTDDALSAYSFVPFGTI